MRAWAPSIPELLCPKCQGIARTCLVFPQADRLVASILRGYIMQLPPQRRGFMRAPLVARVPTWPEQGRRGQQQFQIGSTKDELEHSSSTPSTPLRTPSSVVHFYILATISV